MTTVYVAMICDRHTDPEPSVFTTPEAAIGYARAEVQDYARHPESIEEHEPPDGWLYYATWSNEGDSAWVLERELDPES